VRKHKLEQQHLSNNNIALITCQVKVNRWEISVQTYNW